MRDTFETARLRFRPLAEADRDLYCALYGDEDTMRHIGAALPLEQASRQFDLLLRASRRSSSTARATTWAMWVVSVQTDDSTIGIFSVRIADAQADMGAMLHRQWRGQGMVTEAVAAMVDRLFQRERVALVTASHRHDNAAAEGVLRRMGFAPEQLEGGAMRWSVPRPS